MEELRFDELANAIALSDQAGIFPLDRDAGENPWALIHRVKPKGGKRANNDERKRGYETRYSAQLGALANPLGAHGLGAFFANSIVQLANPKLVQDEQQYFNPLNTTVRMEEPFTEESTNSTGKKIKILKYIDLMVIDEESKRMLVIENKMFSAEGDNQTVSYRRVIDRDYQSFEKTFVYLTMEKSEPGDPEWVPIGYEQIIPLLESSAKISDNPTYSLDIQQFIEDVVDNLLRCRESRQAELLKIGFLGGRGARESGRVVTRDFVREISILQLAKISQREVVRTLNKNKVDQGHLKFVTDYFNSDPESPWIEIYSAIERNEKWREKYFRNTPYSSEALNHKRSRIRIRSVVDYLWVKLTQSSGQMHSFTKHLKYVEERTIGSSDFKREAVDTIIRFHNDLVGVDYPVESSSIETPEFVIETQKTGKELTVYYRGDRVGYLSYSMMNGAWAVKIGPLGYVEAEPSFQVSEFDKSIEIVNEIHRYVGI